MSHLGDAAQVILKEQFVNSADLTTIGVATESAQIVFCAWVSVDHLGLSLIDSDEQGRNASLRRVWVPEAYRCKGIASLGLEFTEQQAEASGFENMWSFVLIDNVASRQLHKKLGYEQRGDAHIVTRFGRRYARWRLGNVRQWRQMRVGDDVSGL
jgi:GNAT superfamily N-acetyltransferase